MSFFSELINKKKELKSCQTVITSLTGNRYIECKNESGEVERRILSGTCPGFVVDEKLDVQIAEILDFLYLSSQDPAQDMYLLTNHKITHVLSIGVDIPESVRSPDVKFTKVELLDEPGEDLRKVFTSCFEIINSIRNENMTNKVLVHCNAGYSRSPTIVIGYLMKTFGYSLNEAINMVKEKRNVKPNDGFIKQLKEYEKELFTKEEISSKINKSFQGEFNK